MGFGRLIFIATSSVAIFFFVSICSAEKAPYSFAKEATSAPPVSYYDYIVVGGGTAGCALAATLATSANVLLLERGGLPYNNPNVTELDRFPLLFMESSPNSAVQQFISTDGVFNHRARILGGGTAVSGGFYTRACTNYVKKMGWDPLLVNKSYKWVERKVVFKPRLRNWQAAVRNGLLEAKVLPNRGFTYKHLQGTKIGGTLFDKNGYRHSAADLLQYANPTKLTTYLHAIVQKILIKTSQGHGPKAYGVLFKDSMGIEHTAYLKYGPKNEIILSAGAIGSPQLLMLSGIGPASQLKAHGISIILDQPMVGRGMADNPRNSIVIPTSKPVDVSLIQVVGIPNFGSFVAANSGYMESYSSNGAAQNDPQSAISSFMASTNQTLPNNPYAQEGSIFEKIDGPFSAGHLELQSKDSNDSPRITFNYFQDPRDLKKCVQGMKIVKKVVESKSISYFQNASFQSLVNLTLSRPINLRKKHAESAFSLKHYCNDTVVTLWHYHGGCQIDKVVDRDYKVIGVDALRVVDGSTFLDSPGTNPLATVMMLGRYMGQKILKERIHNGLLKNVMNMYEDFL